MAFKSTRTEKNTMRTTPKNNNSSVKKDHMTDKKQSNRQEGINLNTPTAMERKETKRLIKPKTMSQDISMTPEINLNKTLNVNNINTNFATNNLREKSMKREKSFAAKIKSENYKKKKVKT